METPEHLQDKSPIDELIQVPESINEIQTIQVYRTTAEQLNKFKNELQLTKGNLNQYKVNDFAVRCFFENNLNERVQFPNTTISDSIDITSTAEYLDLKKKYLDARDQHNNLLDAAQGSLENAEIHERNYKTAIGEYNTLAKEYNALKLKYESLLRYSQQHATQMNEFYYKNVEKLSEVAAASTGSWKKYPAAYFMNEFDNLTQNIE